MGALTLSTAGASLANAISNDITSISRILNPSFGNTTSAPINDLISPTNNYGPSYAGKDTRNDRLVGEVKPE